jgi:hypothetical protein
MTATQAQIDLSAIKERQRWTWASGDLAALADRHDREAGPSIAVPAEYVEAVAVRAS